MIAIIVPEFGTDKLYVREIVGVGRTTRNDPYDSVYLGDGDGYASPKAWYINEQGKEVCHSTNPEFYYSQTTKTYLAGYLAGASYRQVESYVSVDMTADVEALAGEYQATCRRREHIRETLEKSTYVTARGKAVVVAGRKVPQAITVDVIRVMDTTYGTCATVRDSRDEWTFVSLNNLAATHDEAYICQQIGGTECECPQCGKITAVKDYSYGPYTITECRACVAYKLWSSPYAIERAFPKDGRLVHIRLSFGIDSPITATAESLLASHIADPFDTVCLSALADYLEEHGHQGREQIAKAIENIEPQPKAKKPRKAKSAK